MTTQSFQEKWYALRERIAIKSVEIANPIYRAIMPKNPRWYVRRADLRQLPDGTLGKNYADFLDKNQFDELPYLESHDVYHVLLNYPPTLLGEAQLGFWLFGNGKYSIEVVNTVLGGIFVLPDYWKNLYHHYRLGKQSRRIGDWDLQYFMSEKTEVLRGVIFDKNVSISLSITRS